MRRSTFHLIVISLLAITFWQSHADFNATTTAWAKEPALQSATPVLLSKDDYYKPLTPNDIHKRTAIDVVKVLTRRHYRKLDLDDALSTQLFDRYLSDIDGDRLYFLLKDIEAFKVHRTQLDNQLAKGILQPAFQIFNIYQERLTERFIYLVNRLGNDFSKIDLTIDEAIETDRELADWPVQPIELIELWRKRLKNEILNLKLSGKPLDEIQDLLLKRYRSQLNRIRQTNSEDVFNTYMNALASIFDPHTQYFSPSMSENFQIQMSLSLEGIGAVLQTENEHTKVIRLVPGGPAEKSKQLMPGDLIVGVAQGESGEMADVVGWRLDDVVKLIRGPKGTVVRLEILPETLKKGYKTKIIRITRNTVKLEEQAAKKRILDLDYNGDPYKIGVIDIPTFYLDFKGYNERRDDYKSTTKDVHRLLMELQASSVAGIIIDLRDNGGGALQEANELTGLFIKKGPTVQVRNANGRLSSLFDKDPKIVYEGPLLVLVNRMSASAAEIFAGAIQDYNRGIIAGSQTYGKGTVQSLLDLDHGQLKLTFAKFYRITGDSTQHTGVVPDIIFPSIYDMKKIGESALPNALPWSNIRSTRYRPYPDLEPQIDQIRGRHDKRRKTSPDFVYVLESIENRKMASLRTTLPLAENQRKKLLDDMDRRRLATENKKRLAKGLQPLEKLPENDEEESRPSNEQRSDEEPDPLLVESGYVLLDLISLAKAPVLEAQAGQPVQFITVDRSGIQAAKR